MKKKTGELGWLVLTDSQIMSGKVQKLFEYRGTDKVTLCEKLQDVQTGTVTWEPIPIIQDGKIEL